MTGQAHSRSKLILDSQRVTVAPTAVARLATSIFERVGCAPTLATVIADHLVDAELCGVESHGVMRVLQYAEQFEVGVMRAGAIPELRQNDRGAWRVDAGDGSGIPAMRLATDHVCALAKREGMAAIAVCRAGHSGRLGAYAETAADSGCLIIIIGGGNRREWPMVTPFGGRKPVLPTNPYCFGFPGGSRGPVVVDFATATIAGGWIYAARRAGGQLPEGAVIDAAGRPTRDPEDYFRGGAILPAGGAKGYGLAVMAELICEAMLGPVTSEAHSLLIALDTTRFREPHAIQEAAEEILTDLRTCPPARGFDQVEVPGERERDRRQTSARSGIAVPARTWKAILALADRLGARPEPVTLSDNP